MKNEAWTTGPAFTRIYRTRASFPKGLTGELRIYGILHEIHSLDTDLRPVTLSGDIIALDDDVLPDGDL
ncbi:hypothetical protein ARMGADRAFT_1086835 [Armillaria gallica]|uniref:Uncharacterized protein n=1 Tax=Armillaria gallica TaxID=47427 RepID=A0A2H3CW59_ARMGA|nr:hypothetical protein ARMGADRAFT_1086835 [Armillaria gallica]